MKKSGFLPVGQMITLQNRLRYRRCLPGFRFSSAICSRSRNIKACHIKTWNWTVSALKSGLPECCFPKLQSRNLQFWSFCWSIRNQVFSKEEIFEYAWDEHYMGETKTLDVHISNIRKKIKAVTQEEYIDTVWGNRLPSAFLIFTLFFTIYFAFD